MVQHGTTTTTTTLGEKKPPPVQGKNDCQTACPKEGPPPVAARQSSTSTLGFPSQKHVRTTPEKEGFQDARSEWRQFYGQGLVDPIGGTHG